VIRDSVADDRVSTRDNMRVKARVSEGRDRTWCHPERSEESSVLGTTETTDCPEDTEGEDLSPSPGAKSSCTLTQSRQDANTSDMDRASLRPGLPTLDSVLGAAGSGGDGHTLGKLWDGSNSPPVVMAQAWLPGLSHLPAGGRQGLAGDLNQAESDPGTETGKPDRLPLLSFDQLL
jgi:hypothetical protein